MPAPVSSGASRARKRPSGARLVPGEPDDPAVVGIPIALLERDVDDHRHPARVPRSRRDGPPLRRARRRADRDRRGLSAARRRRPTLRRALLSPGATRARRAHPRRVRRRAGRLRGARHLERAREPPFAAHRRGHARDGRRALAAAAALCSWSSCSSGRSPRPCRRLATPDLGDIPDPLYFTYFMTHSAVRGGVFAGARRAARAAAGLGPACVRRSRRRSRYSPPPASCQDRGQLHVPPPQAGRRLAARRDGPVAPGTSPRPPRWAWSCSSRSRRPFARTLGS